MRRELDPPGRTSPITRWVFPVVGVLLFSLDAVPPLLEQQLIGVPDWQLSAVAVGLGILGVLALVRWTDHPGTRVLLAGFFGSILYRLGGSTLVVFDAELRLSTLALAELVSVTVAAAAFGWLLAEVVTSSEDSAGETGA